MSTTSPPGRSNADRIELPRAKSSARSPRAESALDNVPPQVRQNPRSAHVEDRYLAMRSVPVKDTASVLAAKNGAPPDQRRHMLQWHA